MRVKEAIISIKIPIIIDEYLREFIFKNINMRRQIWNDFVEESKRIEKKTKKEKNEVRRRKNSDHYNIKQITLKKKNKKDMMNIV